MSLAYQLFMIIGGALITIPWVIFLVLFSPPPTKKRTARAIRLAAWAAMLVGPFLMVAYGLPSEWRRFILVSLVTIKVIGGWVYLRNYLQVRREHKANFAQALEREQL